MWSQIATILPLLHFCRAVQVNYIKEDPQAVGYVYKNTNGANKLYYRLGSNRPVVMEYNKKVGAGKYYKPPREMAKGDKGIVPNEQPFVKMETDYAIPTTKDGKMLSQITKYISNRHTHPLRVDLPTDFNVPPPRDTAKNFLKMYAPNYPIGMRSMPIPNKDVYMVKSPENYYFPFENFGNKGYEPKDFDGKAFGTLTGNPKSWNPDYGSNVDFNRIMQRTNSLQKRVDSKLQVESENAMKNKKNKAKKEQYKSNNEKQNRRDQSTSGRSSDDAYRNPESSVKGFDYKKNRDIKNYEYIRPNRKFVPVEFSEMPDQLGNNPNNMKERVRISRNLRSGGLSHHANASRSFLITSRRRRIHNK